MQSLPWNVIFKTLIYLPSTEKKIRMGNQVNSQIDVDYLINWTRISLWLSKTHFLLTTENQDIPQRFFFVFFSKYNLHC